MDHYLYLDETGTPDFESSPGERYFGVGSTHWNRSHGDALWDGHALRLAMEAIGIQLPKGLHAKNDRASMRAQVYRLIAQQDPRFDSTIFRKEQALPHVKAAGAAHFYKLALWLHLKYVIPNISAPNDRVFLIAGSLQTSRKRSAIRNAVEDVARQLGGDRVVIPCIWDAPTAWGIQTADYPLWRVHRQLEGLLVPDYAKVADHCIRPAFRPWEK